MNDYDLNELIKINQGDFRMRIPLRYIPHYLLNDYEPFSTQIVKTFLDKGSVFVDIGTHLGYYSLLALSCKQDIKVIGFEPVEINFEITKNNLQLNNYKNFRLYNFAASNKNERKKFFLTEAAGECGFYNNHLAPVISEIGVQTVILDNFLYGKKVDFIKIDVEGHELKVLKGLERTFEKNKYLYLLVEYNLNALKNGKSSGDKLLKILTSFNFIVYFIDEKKEKLFLFDKNYKGWKDLTKLQYVNLFCLRKKDPKHQLLQKMSNHSIDGSYIMSSAKHFKIVRKNSNKINILAELEFYKKLHQLEQMPDSPVQILSRLKRAEIELGKIKSSKLWKIFNCYKNPKNAVPYYLKSVMKKYLIKTDINSKWKIPNKKIDQDKLHLGCGEVLLNGWLNIDINNISNKEIHQLDLSQNFPFESNQTSKIFTEHIIECFPKEIGIQFLKECYRVLKPAGVFRIGFSDCNKLLQAYYKKDRSYRQKMQTDMSPLITNFWDEFVTDMLYSWGRRYYYTCKLLKEFMKKVGFTNIEVKRFGESKYGFENDTRGLPDNTYLEAKKLKI